MENRKLKNINVYYEVNLIFNKDSKKYKTNLEKEISNDLILRNIQINIIDKGKHNIYNMDCINIEVKCNNDNFYYICNKNKYKNLQDILNDFLIVPKLYLNDFDVNNYKEKLTTLEHKRDIIKSNLYKKYDKLFKENFNVLRGIDDIYESYTGAIFFKDYEWEEIKNNNLKNLFETKVNNSYIYSLPLDNGIILRGPDIYYYFSSDVSRFEKPNLKQIKVWFDNCYCFLDKTIFELNKFKINNNYDIRLLLGVIDNIRNIILLLLNCELLSINNNENFIYYLNNHERDIDNYILLVQTYQKLINDLCFNRPLDSKITMGIVALLEKVRLYSQSTYKKISTIANSFILGKCFNPLREIDNYFENYIVCENAITCAVNEIHDTLNEINLIGVLYGGLELPFIITNNQFINLKINIGFIFENHGMYLDRQKKNKTLIDKNLKEYGSINKKIPTYIIDDNMMSGVTMQLIYNQLYLNEFTKLLGMIVIRHPNLNRLPQLVHFNTAMNLDMIDKMVFGLITDTPYTKIKFKTNLNNMFVNELNIFSTMTEVFLKALYINNSFIKGSQVDIFKGYSEGKNDKI